jgi:hypothetical protein
MAIYSTVQPQMDKIGLALGGIYGFFKRYLPDHDLGATELPEAVALPFTVGQAGVELAFQLPGIAQTVLKRDGIYNRPINFLPDATSTQSRVPLQTPSQGGWATRVEIRAKQTIGYL